VLEQDRKQTGWSVGQAAWRLGVSIRDVPELEAGARSTSFETERHAPTMTVRVVTGDCTFPLSSVARTRIACGPALNGCQM
jgi:hypothetical protein